MYQEFLSDPEKRREYWRQKKELYQSLETARPDDGHLAITRLEHRNQLAGVITQNIDGLHQIAGIPAGKVLELHGTNCETVCLNCRDCRPWPEVVAMLNSGIESPSCKACGGILKPNTISFGQNLNPMVLNRAFSWARDCDLMLVVGSTLVVEPAASIPRVAKESGAGLVIINLSETPLDDEADIRIFDAIGKTLMENISEAIINER
jgi:NAD-dependent deacetylase